MQTCVRGRLRGLSRDRVEPCHGKDFLARAVSSSRSVKSVRTAQMTVAFSAIGNECFPVYCFSVFMKQKPGQLVGEAWQPAGKSAKLKTVLREYLGKLLNLHSLTHNKNA